MTSVETKENENRKKKDRQQKQKRNKQQKKNKKKQQQQNSETNVRKGGQARPLFRAVWLSRILFGVQSNEISSLQFSVWFATLLGEVYLISTITVRIAPAFVSAILNKLIEHMV